MKKKRKKKHFMYVKHMKIHYEQNKKKLKPMANSFTMVEENACTNTHFFRQCVYMRESACECVLHQNVNCETSTSFFNMYSHFVYVSVCSRAPKW